MELLKRLLVGAIAVCSVAAAHATPVTWVDTIDLNPDPHIYPGSSFSYTHGILDDGYTPLVDSISGYTLAVDLYDDDARSLEVALIDVAGIFGDTVWFELSGQEFGGWSLAGNAQLALTGSYDVTISSLLGDFFLGSSTLAVRGNEPQSVPEPSSAALLALALLAVGIASRRPRKPRVA